MSETRKKRNKTISNPIHIAVLSLISGNIIFIVCICISATVITNIHIKQDYLYLLIIASSAFSSLFSSFCTSAKIRKNKLISGLLMSVSIVTLHFIIILCFNNSSLAIKTYLIFPADIIMGLTGAIAGINLIKK